MTLGLSLAIFALLAVVISAAGYWVYSRPGKYQQQLDDMLGAEQVTAMEAPGSDRKWIVRVVQHIGEKAPISPQDATMARRELIAAGFRTDRAVRVYYGSKIVLGVILFGAAVFARTYIDNPVLSIVVIPAGALGGFYLPNLILDRLIGRRQQALRFALPDALDLMVVCMEAGLGLDQAIANVSRELRSTHKEISEELGLVTLEMRAGKRRGEALKNLADRTGEPDLRKLVATMIQSDRFGTSVAESLRAHSDFMRIKRRQEAEERAGKVGVKLVFPIFLFILPAILVVAAGPGLLQLFKQLFPLMNSFK